MAGLSSFNSCLDPVAPCVGRNDYAHRVFLTTNESMQTKTLSTLAKHPLTGNTMVGVSGFFTLNAAAIRGTTCPEPTGEIENIILIDRSVRVEHFWKQMKGIITSSSNRLEVIDKVKLLLESEKERYYGNGWNTPEDTIAHLLKSLETEVLSGQSWLSSDDKFAKVKQVFDSGHFIFKRMDLCKPAAFQSMSAIFKERNITIDTIYLSNTVEYIGTPTEKRAFTESLEPLIAPKTLVVHTKPRGCKNCIPLEQFVQRRNSSPVSDLFPPPPLAPCQQSLDLSSLTCEQLRQLIASGNLVLI